MTNELNFNIGDVVSLEEKDSLLPVKGEVRGFFEHKDKLYIRIYSFYKRREILYYFLENKQLVESKRKKRRKKPNAYDDGLITYEFDDEKRTGEITKIIIKLLSVTLILIFLFSYIPFEHLFTSYTYQTFLSKNFTLNELFYAVFSRINYRSDFDDFWNTPLTAWNTKNGDCEEFASITSDWLTRHGFENYLTGLSIKGSFMGHAVVFVKYKGFFYIIDPTRALEKSGVKKLDKASNLKEAVMLYAELPAYIFKVPGYDGEKEIIKTVE